LASYQEGNLTPVYFGSALKDFAITSLLNGLHAYAPSPRPRAAQSRTIQPDEKNVTGFVFKVQANMDKKHRDRIAYLRLCSGQFKRGMKLYHARTGKTISVNNPIFFFAQERELAENALPGDIIGIPNHGTLRVGDTLSEGEQLRIIGIPNFAPEILRRVRLSDPMRMKQLRSALNDLAEEGVTQVFRPRIGAQWIVGVVGQLQLEVLVTRIQNEYQVTVEFENAPFETARWLASDDQSRLLEFAKSQSTAIADDRDNAPVYLARNAWELDYIASKWPDIQFKETRERG
jgi:peptide chain release factor 3